MNKESIMFRYLFLILLMASLGIPSGTFAGDYDGSKPILISVLRVNGCLDDGTCYPMTVEEANLPQFFKVDFESKKISRVAFNSDLPDSIIKRMEHVDGKLILQGAEDGFEDVRDGFGWTVAIAEDTGKVVLTASGEGVAYVVFGASVPVNP